MANKWLKPKEFWGKDTPLTYKSSEVGKLILTSDKAREMLFKGYHQCFPNPPSSPEEEERNASNPKKQEYFKSIDPFERQFFIDPVEAKKLNEKSLGLSNYPLFRLLASVRGNSMGFFNEDPDLFKLFVKYGIISESDHKFNICKDCDNKSVSIIRKDYTLDCACKVSTEIKLFHVNNASLLNNWKHNPSNFLEDVCFFVLEDLGFVPLKNVKVFKSEVLGDTKGRTVTDLDLFIGDKKIVILCSTAPQDGREKDQARLTKSMGLKVIFVTTEKEQNTKIDCDKIISLSAKGSFGDLKGKLEAAIKELSASS
jgi:hypothetical protein